MSDTQGQPEPSMEEILASIRRIINEDGEEEDGGDGQSAAEAADTPAVPPAAEDPPAPFEAPATPEPVAAAPPPPPLEPTPAPAPAPAAPPPSRPALVEEEDVLELSEDMIDTPPPLAAAPVGPPGGLVSGATELAAAAAFGSLMNGRPSGGDLGALPLGRGDTTVEQIVRELLRPLLKEWLDAHLPGMVDRIVREEVERIARSTRH